MENNDGKIFEVPKWEYRKIDLRNDAGYKELSELGKKGWDAVGILQGNTNIPDLLLKRQIGTVRLMEVSKEQTPAQNRGGGNGYDGY